MTLSISEVDFSIVESSHIEIFRALLRVLLSTSDKEIMSIPGEEYSSLCFQVRFKSLTFDIKKYLLLNDRKYFR